MVPPRAVPVLAVLLTGSLLCAYAMSTCEVTVRVRTPTLGEFVLHATSAGAR